MADITVFHVVPDLRRQAGGIAGVVPALATALRTKGVDSHFVTLAHDDDFPWSEQTTCGRLADGQRPDRLTKLVEDLLASNANDRRKSVVVHNHGLWDMLNFSAMRASFRKQTPTVVSVHGMLLPWARRNNGLRKDLAWVLYQKRDLLRADRLHVTSAAEERIVGSIAGVSAVESIPFGVDIPTVAAPITGSKRQLLFLGRLHPIKNLKTLIRAFAEVAPEEWILRLAGPDEKGHRAELNVLVGQLGVKHRVSFAGPVYGLEKERELATAQALVLPSFTENFGAVVAEALAVGRPVIASRGTPWQAVEEERCGWWVSPDKEGLTRAIDELVRTPTSALTEMGARGRNLVKRAYSWDHAATAMARLYADIAAHSSSPGPK